MARCLRRPQPEVAVVEEKIDSVLLRLDRIIDGALAVMESSFTPSSNPPGARASGLTSPSTSIDVSCVSLPNRDHDSGETAFFTTTACSSPVPSRITMKATLPEERT